MRTTRSLTSTLAVGAALVLAGCGEGTAPGASLSQTEALEIAEAVTTDADAMIAASGTDVAAGFRLAPTPGGPALSGPPCFPQITPPNPANVDNDIVPDSIRLDFSACANASGTIDLIDPVLTPGTFGLKSVFTDFSITRQRGPRQRDGTAIFNGTRQITGDDSQINHLIVDFRTDITFPNGFTATHVKNWNGAFVADVGGSIQHHQPLPSGTLNLAGTSEWSGGQRNASLAVTGTNLHFDASCTVEPRFDSGTVVVVHTRNGETTTVTIEHTACGQYTVTRS